MIGYLAVNGLWTLANWRAYSQFRRAWRQPRHSQHRLLLQFLRRNAATEYGRRYGYAKIRTIEQFQQAVPIVRYEDLAPWIERICRGEPNILTAEPVLLVETTSGSSAAIKYIPYTATLKREFQQAVGTWMFDLFTHRPALLAGAQYWSVSPAAREKDWTPGGIPVGVDDDTEYLGPLSRLAARAVMVVGGDVCRISDLDAYRRVTLERLTRCRNLRLISVWNPSFLTLLLDRLPGGASPAEVWPSLKLISCWTSLVAARFLPELRRLFPDVEIQGKGLLATEGVVSIPQMDSPAARPAITSHFLEFVDDGGRPHLVDELQVGCRYRVVLTTGGGLARYWLGDLVEVVAPGAIEFVGRADEVSDMCGEKLSAIFVAQIVQQVLTTRRVSGFAMLAPEWGSPPYYCLLIESNAATEVAEDIERQLRTSVQYDYCRRLGQLGPVLPVRIYDADERYLRACAALGRRLGDVKQAHLRREFGWTARLTSRTPPRASSPADGLLLERLVHH